MTSPSDREVLEFALTLSEEAGKFILPLWRQVAVDHKLDGSEVTEADRGAEQLLRRLIAERYPDHAILGEEFGGDHARNAEHLWLLDPVDGTASFAVGLPLFGTLIAFLRNGAPRAGVIGLHALGETVYAATGQGCWLRRKQNAAHRIRTSNVRALSEAFVISTSIERTDLEPRINSKDATRDPSSVRLSRLYQQARRFRWSGDCVNYSLLCQGRIDVAVDPRMNPWDIAAVVPCVLEAGGALSSLDGNEDVVWQSNLVACASLSLHAEVLRLLASEDSL